MTQLSLFSGIGFETVGQCEFADYPTTLSE